MCGIAGFYALGQTTRSRDWLRRVTDTVAHRGPDAWGVRLFDRHAPEAIDPDRGHVGLGHRRLSILDLSEAGRQPMADAADRFVVSFNGEVYNYKDLAAELVGTAIEAGEPPPRWRSGSDTEVMLESIRRWGPSAVERWVGMFAVTFYDRESDTLYAYRDRQGKKPFYWAQADGIFVFGSELKVVLEALGRTPTIRPASVADYLHFQYVPDPHTIFEGIHKLAPGHRLTVTKRGVEVARYWDPVPFATGGTGGGPRVAAFTKAMRRMTDAEAEDRLDELLLDAVGLRLQADVPVGCFLSGGLDSSLVSLYVRRHRADRFKTFSVGFADAEYDESARAAEISRLIDTQHEAYTMTQADVAPLARQLVFHYDEPMGDASQLPTFLVSRLARKEVTVVLSGDGGDELFFGYSRYIALLRRMRVSQLMGPWGQSVAARLLPGLRRLTKRGARYDSAFTGDLHADFAPWVSVFREAEAEALARGVRRDRPFAFDDLLARRDIPGWDRLMLCDLQTYLPGAVLAKVDRATMANAQEARAPLLDHRLVQFALALPFRMKWRDGQSKWLLRRLLARRFPPSVFTPGKKGFGWPMEQWVPGLLSQPEHARDFDENALTKQGIFSPSAVQAVRDDMAKHRDWGRANRLFCYLNFQNWARRFAPAQAIQP